MSNTLANQCYNGMQMSYRSSSNKTMSVPNDFMSRLTTVPIIRGPGMRGFYMTCFNYGRKGHKAIINIILS
ncbi:unnamed protein product [Gordionus sp. m RMFG-2023]